jgi:hypothetical protein
MTAARRGQKAAFLQSATSNVAKLPQWGPSAYLSHPSTILASAPSVPPDTRLHVEREGYSDKA